MKHMVVVENEAGYCTFVGPFEDQPAAELWISSLPPDPTIRSAWLHQLTSPNDVVFATESPTKAIPA